VNAPSAARRANDPEALARNIDATRGDVIETLNALRARLSPRQIFHRSRTFVAENGRELLTNVARSVKDNPFPLVLAGIGFAVLVFGGTRANNSLRAGEPAKPRSWLPRFSVGRQRIARDISLAGEKTTRRALRRARSNIGEPSVAGGLGRSVGTGVGHILGTALGRRLGGSVAQQVGGGVGRSVGRGMGRRIAERVAELVSSGRRRLSEAGEQAAEVAASGRERLSELGERSSGLASSGREMLSAAAGKLSDTAASISSRLSEAAQPAITGAGRALRQSNDTADDRRVLIAAVGIMLVALVSYALIAREREDRAPLYFD
jgi:hypothetical protein